MKDSWSTDAVWTWMWCHAIHADVYLPGCEWFRPRYHPLFSMFGCFVDHGRTVPLFSLATCFTFFLLPYVIARTFTTSFARLIVDKCNRFCNYWRVSRFQWIWTKIEQSSKNPTHLRKSLPISSASTLLSYYQLQPWLWIQRTQIWVHPRSWHAIPVLSSPLLRTKVLMFRRPFQLLFQRSTYPHTFFDHVFVETRM